MIDLADRLESTGALIRPLLWIWALTLTTVLAMQPLVGAAYASQPEALQATMRTGLWVVGVLSPVIAAVKAGILATVAWAVLVLTGMRAPRPRSLVSAVLLGEVLLAVQGLWVAFILHLRGTDRLAVPADLMVVTGLDALVTDPSSPLAALARGVSPFHVAWVVLLALLFAALARASWLRGAVAAATCWVVMVGVAVLRAVVV